jgi:acetyltransferase-like isoleucine patch superfamily enzyme
VPAAPHREVGRSRFLAPSLGPCNQAGSLRGGGSEEWGHASAASKSAHATASRIVLRAVLLTDLVHRLLQQLAYVAPGGGRVRPALHRLRGVRIGARVWIGQQVYIDDVHPDAITIGNDCTIGLRTSIFSHFYWGPKRPAEHAAPVVIEDEVYIGPHCVILGNVRIGRGAVIRAGTVVSRNVPAHTMWGSPPAEALAEVHTPLTAREKYESFLLGLRPVSRRRANGTTEALHTRDE